VLLLVSLFLAFAMGLAAIFFAACCSRRGLPTVAVLPSSFSLWASLELLLRHRIRPSSMHPPNGWRLSLALRSTRNPLAEQLGGLLAPAVLGAEDPKRVERHG
jgi:hypothetical protein